MRRARAVAVAVAACGLLCACASVAATPPSKAPAQKAPAPASSLPAGLATGWYATIDTTMGPIVARLLPEQAPQAVAYFAALAEGRLPWPDLVTGEMQQGPYYDGIDIHRAVAANRFEAGDRTGTGRGAPLFYVPLERGPVDFSGPGRLGLTRSGGGRISAVVFFVTAAGTPWFNEQHPCFGTVVQGSDVVWAIAGSKTEGSGKPLQPITIRTIRIEKVGDPPPLAQPVPYTPPGSTLEANPEYRRDR